VLHNHRQRGRDHVCPKAADHQIDFVHVKQLRVNARNSRWVGLIVIKYQFHRPAQQAAFGIDIAFPDLHGQQRGPAVRRQSAGQRHAEADCDRGGGPGGRCRRDKNSGEQCFTPRL
jgi:hypothetical protein